MMTWDDAADFTEENEGFRCRTYRDTRGNLTGGIGCKIYAGLYLPPSIWRQIYRYQYRQAINQFLEFEEKNGLEFDMVRITVCVDMIFCMGYQGFLKFQKMIASLKKEDYEEAAAQIMDSSFARGEHKNRAKRLAKMMSEGDW